MKFKLISTLILSAGLFSGAQGTQVMVAGWDFSPFAFDQFSSVDGVNLQGSLPANFTARPSDGLGLPNFTGAPAFGTLYYDGTNGSTAFDLNASGILPSGDGELGLLGGTGSIGASGNLNALFAQGQQFANPKALGLTFNGSITYAIDLTTFELGSVGEEWSLRFAHMYKPGPGDTSTSATIAWDYSLNGADFVSTGITTVLTSNAIAEIHDLSSFNALKGKSQVFFRANYSGIGTGVAYVDNFQVFAAPMDEPSTGGSLFFLSNPASSLLADDWYFTPLGKVFVGSEPWLWSPQFGWFFSPPENTSEAAFIYIAATPFQTWVYVDQTAADAEGFWGFAFDPAADAAVAGWFWFFNQSSENTVGKFFLLDLEGNQVLSFDDQSR